ncbi:MAG: phospho-N-acetylmuramoyl-pentapeptide-transferase [Rikenellaceae bacterium]
MFYHLFNYLEQIGVDIPGAGMFQYISFRSLAAIVTALIIIIFAGKQIIRLLQRLQIGEEVRDLGLNGQIEKKGTPTMGGVIILLAVLLPTLLFGRLDNIYVLLLIGSTVWLGLLGFLDDYIKVFRGDKDGLHGYFKIIGQVSLGLIVGLTMWYSSDIVVRDTTKTAFESQYIDTNGETQTITQYNVSVDGDAHKSSSTTIPFMKNNVLDYRRIGGDSDILTLIIYVIISIFIVTAVSNGANLTDGLDGLMTGVSIPIAAVLGALAYLSGNIVYADYLNIMYIPDSGELVVFAAALFGALIGFLWYNTYPAQIFMGDTGSLAIGGIIAVFAICIRKELLLPLLCGIFLIESLSVMIQVGYYKYTKRRCGEGRRIFLMSPLHHHYQKVGYFETKIVMRFCIISILLAALTIATLKMR